MRIWFSSIKACKLYGSDENISSRSAKLRYAIRSKDNYFYPEDLKEKFAHYLNLESEYV